MVLSRLLVRVSIGVAAMVVVAGLVTIDTEQWRRLRRQWRERLRQVGPALGLVLLSLGVNSLVRDVVPRLSWLIDWNITGLIYRLEGGFVATVQSIATPALTQFFSAAYVYGYVFLLIFPFVIYFATEKEDALREFALAFTINYLIGLVVYTVFIAYGPRNLIPDLVESLLYTTHPETQLLTREVNVNTNVFPSLHTSLSVTVVVQAWRTRAEYARWLVIAAPIAASVVAATMYLGIHWGTDVLAGGVLGVGSVWFARRYASLIPEWDRVRHLFDRIEFGE